MRVYFDVHADFTCVDRFEADIPDDTVDVQAAIRREYWTGRAREVKNVAQYDERNVSFANVKVAS